MISEAVQGFTLSEGKVFHDKRCETKDFIFNNKLKSKQECIDMCTDRVDCVAMEWNHDDGKCRLSSKCTHTQRKSGRMFYEKGKIRISFTRYDTSYILIYIID